MDANEKVCFETVGEIRSRRATQRAIPPPGHDRPVAPPFQLFFQEQRETQIKIFLLQPKRLGPDGSWIASPMSWINTDFHGQ
jgi:hypothetical protein